MTTYCITTVGPDGRDLDEYESHELPTSLRLDGEFKCNAWGDEIAYGTAPAYLGDRRARGRVRVRVLRVRG